jgi:hypothetical protein
MRRTTLTPVQRCRQRSAGIENEKIARPKVIPYFVEAGVFDSARWAIDYQQAHLVAPNTATLWRLFCAQLRRQNKREWR